MRKFRLFQRDAYFSIDFLAQKAMLFRRVPTADGGKKIEMQSLETDPEDALAAQLDVFVRARAQAQRRGPGRRDRRAGGGRAAHRAARDRRDAGDRRPGMSTVLLSVGDASGDVYASDFVRELRARVPDAALRRARRRRDGEGGRRARRAPARRRGERPRSSCCPTCTGSSARGGA